MVDKNKKNKVQKKILLIYPGPKISMPRFPMSILVLSSYLKKNGYNVELFDTRIDDFKDIDFNNIFCVGISSMSGLQLEYGLKVAKFIKEKNNNLPIIWGGVHPTFYPEQTIKSEYVDIVVRGEGEITLLELVKKIEKNEAFDHIDGITYIKNNKIINNQDREFLDLNILELPSFDLIKIEKYADMTDGFSYESSRGCPHRCNFCYNLFFHRRKWRAKTSKKVLNEIDDIVKKYSIKKIYFVEDELFINKPRAIKIFNGLKKKPFDIEWTAFCRADFLNKCTDSEVKIFKDSGCKILMIGVESGSPEMLKKINKDITTMEVENAVKKCVKNKIMPVLSFIIGFPDETKNDLEKTLNFYDKLIKISNDIEINGCFVYAPYPGTPFFKVAIEKGYRPKQTLEEWSNWNYNDISNTPWLSKKKRNELEIISIIARFRYFAHRLEVYTKTFKQQKIGSSLGIILYQFSLPILMISANFRWKNRFFKYAIEWKLWRYISEVKFKLR